MRKVKRGVRFASTAGSIQWLDFSYSTISSWYGIYSLMSQCANLYGAVPALQFSVDHRTWSSSSSYAYPSGVTIAMAFGDNGGADLMRTIGEPSASAKTMGYQRPALNH